MIVEVLEGENAFTVAVAKAQPDTDNTPVGNLLGEAVAAKLSAPRAKRRAEAAAPFCSVAFSKADKCSGFCRR